MTSTNTDTSVIEDFDGNYREIEGTFAFNRKKLVADLLAGTTEQQQLDIVASPLSSHAIVEALAQSEHESVLRAIVERGADDNKVAAVAIVAQRGAGEVSRDAKALIVQAMSNRPASVLETLNHFISRAF